MTAAASGRTLRTESGPLELVPAAIDDLRPVARYWPMELLASRDEGSPFGLVFQHGDEQVHGVKLQPADVPERDASVLFQLDRIAIAAALPGYLTHAHRGVLLPTVYIREKGAGLAETGLALFAGPDPASRPAVEERGNTMHDDRLGAGATRMVIDMAGAIAGARKSLGFPSPTLIGVDVRPRLALGAIAMDFLVAGAGVFLVSSRVDDDDPIWPAVVRAGFGRLPHAPMVPAGLPGPPPPDAPHA